MEIQEHVPLAPHTMFRIGGNARYFFCVTSDADAREAVQFATEKNLPIFILGGGSNILVADNGFSGVVIQMKNSELEWNENDTLVIAGAGMSWDKLVEESVVRDRYGLENLSGIPGSVGGAAGGNIGAYGAEVKDTIEWVEVLDKNKFNLVRIPKRECQFGYRESVFKHEVGRKFVILRVAFRLNIDAKLDRGYKDIVGYEKQNGEITTLREMRGAVLSIREKKFPQNGEIGTAGSFFKNPVVTREKATVFLSRFPESPNFPQDDGSVKLSAAWIIDNVLKLRGKRDGNVGTWKEQALVVVNYGGAKADDVIHFSQMIIQKTKNETDIQLSPEVIYVSDEVSK